MSHSLQFVGASSPEYIAKVRDLFLEYSEWLGLDLCFQNFNKELAELPGAYAPPKGRLILAVHDDRIAGCIGVRPLEDGVCEMKRLYVRPEFRGKDIGRALVEKLISEATLIGYARMRLDTLPGRMDQAIQLYRSFGFCEIEPYYVNPVEGASFMELSMKRD